MIQVTKSYFEESEKPNYLIFQSLSKYFKLIDNTKYISSWESKGLYNEAIAPYATSDNSLTPQINHHNSKIRLKFNKSCLKHPNKIIYGYGRKVNVYIIYELGASSSNNNDPTLKNCLFGAVTFKKTQILKNMSILVIALGLIEDQTFHFLVVGLANMY